jgi:hypothetical protein
VLILFLISVSLLFPWISHVPALAIFVQSCVLWVYGVVAVSGGFVLFSGGEWLWHNPLHRLRMERALRSLSGEELTVLGYFLVEGAGRHLIVEHGNATLHLVSIGVLSPTTKPTGYWTDAHTYELTPDANEILRTKRIREKIEQRISALKS